MSVNSKDMYTQDHMDLERRIFAIDNPEQCVQERYVIDFDELKNIVDHLRSCGKSIVLTQGVYDLLHIGHAQYLEKAKSYGDVLIVGVDSDALTKKRKGENRPVVPQEERVDMLLRLRHVDLVVLRDIDKELEALIKLVRPDVYIASTSTKDFTVDEELASHCKQVQVLPPQATTSTSARVHQVSMLGADELAAELARHIPDVVKNILDRIKKQGLQ